MSTRRIPLLLAVALTLVLSSFTVNAQQPRSDVPANDNMADAMPITIGKNYLVPNIAAATYEDSDPSTSCGWRRPIRNSVWFTFTAENYDTIYISTGGSLMQWTEYDTPDTMLAVYSENWMGEFEEIACNDDDNVTFHPSAQVVISLSPGRTYYIVAGAGAEMPYLPDSMLKLKTRMLSSWFEPLNASFEAPLEDSGWKVKGGDDDGTVCYLPPYYPWDGICVFRFIGSEHQTTRLSQTLPFPPYYLPRKEAILLTKLYIRAMDTEALEDTSIKVTVEYADRTRPSVRTMSLNGTPGSSFYFYRSLGVEIKSSKVESIKFELKYGESSGMLIIDSVSFQYLADPAMRGSGLLPVPVAPTAG